jgi:positive regulator of sigma E activity
MRPPNFTRLLAQLAISHPGFSALLWFLAFVGLFEFAAALSAALVSAQPQDVIILPDVLAQAHLFERLANGVIGSVASVLLLRRYGRRTQSDSSFSAAPSTPAAG